MAKQLNGIFREWLKFKMPDDPRASMIWGHCVVHLSNPKFSGNVIHTSKISKITQQETFSIAETRNSYYVMLGPELTQPADPTATPSVYVSAHMADAGRPDSLINATMNADPACKKCHGTGLYDYDDGHTAICSLCCKHNVGWWQLEGCYGEDNGRWACKAGCGLIVDKPPTETQFLPRDNL